MNFGEKLKYLRLKKGFSQKEIAHELRISQKTLSNIETGTCDIRLKHFVKLGMIIGFDLCDFLTDPSYYRDKPKNVAESIYFKNVILKQDLSHFKTILKDKNEIIRLLKEKNKSEIPSKN